MWGWSLLGGRAATGLEFSTEDSPLLRKALSLPTGLKSLSREPTANMPQ